MKKDNNNEYLEEEKEVHPSEEDSKKEKCDCNCDCDDKCDCGCDCEDDCDCDDDCDCGCKDGEKCHCHEHDDKHGPHDPECHCHEHEHECKCEDHKHPHEHKCECEEHGPHHEHEHGPHGHDENEPHHEHEDKHGPHEHEPHHLPPHELEAKARQYLEMAQRLQADFDNYRKRVAEQLDFQKQEGIRSVIEVFLPCLDTFKEAKKSITDEKILSGVEMIEDKINNALKTLNVEKIETIGQKYDHNLHEVVAVMKDESKDDDIILDEFQAGYKFNGKVIRYAKVIVNKL